MTMTNDSSKFHSTKKGEKIQEKSIHDILSEYIGLRLVSSNQFDDEFKRFSI